MQMALFALVLAALMLMAVISGVSADWLGLNDKPFMDPKLADVALTKFYLNCKGATWPSPWKDRWDLEHHCAWDGNERGTPPPFGTRCCIGRWHGLPPSGDGGLLFLEHFSRYAEGEVPAEFEVFQVTDMISLWNNKLHGPIWNTTMHTFLHRLDLSHNQFSGELPADFMKRAVLHSELINLGFNKFTGPLPPTLATLTTLQSLRLNDNAFTGSFPAGVEALPLLRQLDLKNNKLAGKVPSLAAMKTLARLDLSGNSFDGPLPDVPESVSHIVLTGNKFSGAIPASYAAAGNLRHFECVGCDLTCPDPNFLAHLPFSTHCKPKNSRTWDA